MSTMFMILQLAMLLSMVSINILITQLLGPKDVAVYTIAIQYVSIGTFFFRMLISPSVPAMIEAHTLKDSEWIKKMLSLFLKAWLALAAGLALMAVLSPLAYHVWIGDKIRIPLYMTVLVAVSQLMVNWNSIFSSHIIGTGKLVIVVISAMLVVIIQIPLSFFLVRFMGMGLKGIVLSSVLALVIPFILAPLQSYLLLHGKAKGIWNR